MNKKEVFKLAKGFRGRAKNCIRIARERVEKALQYSYRDRRNKKRDMRSLWIERINAGTRVHGVNYGNFMHGLVKENIQINRKVLSELSMHEPYSFKALVDVSRTAFPGNRQVSATPKKEDEDLTGKMEREMVYESRRGTNPSSSPYQIGITISIETKHPPLMEPPPTTTKFRSSPPFLLLLPNLTL
ncbi:unnamed protein product [Lactuca virosa]|uniref:Large ribosomal subunit protein bL20c n=1 Tax=Lactuca virosa TaxID=75947 RepID=A0AAU9M6R3_9ASTR|nr:unnamed protein product [Lactuca virosa]